MKFEIRPIQVPMIKHLFSYEKGALWAGMGTGKTSAILYYLRIMQKIDPGPAIIFAPLKVAKFTWPEQKNEFDEFYSLSIAPIVGSVTDRLVALCFKANIYTINYENAIWLQKNFPKHIKFKYLILDESTRVKGLRLRKGSKNAKAIFKMFHDIKYIWELTGTSTSNGLIDLWGQLGYLDRGERLGKTFTGFRDKYFDSIARDNFTIYKPRPFALKEIGNKVKDICLTVKSEKYMDIKTPVVHNLYTDLPDNVKKQYEQMEKEMFISLSKTKDITAWYKSASTLKCMQIANGYIYEDKNKWFYLHSEKIKILESIVEEAAGASLLISYAFKADIEAIQKRFPKAVHLSANSSKNVIDRWNNKEIPLLLGYPAAMHGLNLQHGGNTIIYYGHTWSPEGRQQILERIGPLRQMQSGYNRNVFIYNIIMRNTVDEITIKSHETKRNIQELIDEYTSSKPT